MSGYVTVTDQDVRELQRERVRALELDHARLCLVAAEEAGGPGEQGLREQLVGIERRIAVHVPGPSTVELPAAPPAAPEPLYVDGSDGSLPGTAAALDSADEKVTAADPCDG